MKIEDYGISLYEELWTTTGVSTYRVMHSGKEVARLRPGKPEQYSYKCWKIYFNKNPYSAWFSVPPSNEEIKKCLVKYKVI